MKVVVAQKGAREHYLAARALHRRGMLAAMAVDWYARRNLAFRCLRAFPAMAAARLSSAASEELPSELVISMNGFGLICRLTEKRHGRRGRLHEAFLRTDAAFARRVARTALPEHDVFFGYSYASLEALVAEARRGKLTIVDQIDPGAAEHALVREEAARWPGYALPETPAPDAYWERARREWAAADAILVNSEWTRRLILEDGAPAPKIEILPLAYERPSALPPAPKPPAPPLRVLWLGTVCLRKGIAYLVEAARALREAPVEFLVAGTIAVRREALQEAPQNIRWLGPVPRSAAGELYARSHVFVLPTISDGFAITQLEALTHGLPVIVTPHCAPVVEDGLTGCVVPARDVEALANAIRRFARKPALAERMAPACRARAAEFSVDQYGEGLSRIIESRAAAKRNPC